MTLELTPTQFDSISAFLKLIEERAREPTVHKNTNINVHSIAVASNRSYKSVRVALQNLQNKMEIVNG